MKQWVKLSSSTRKRCQSKRTRGKGGKGGQTYNNNHSKETPRKLGIQRELGEENTLEGRGVPNHRTCANHSGEREGMTVRGREMDSERWTDREKDSQIVRQTDGQRDRESETQRQMHRETDRDTFTNTCTECIAESGTAR